jgi:hypothetical protein
MRTIDTDSVENIKAKLEELNEEAILYDDIEEALIGIGSRFGVTAVACYSYNQAINIYMRDGSTYEEAVEHFGFNVIGAWYGDHTPMFVDFEGF